MLTMIDMLDTQAPRLFFPEVAQGGQTIFLDYNEGWREMAKEVVHHPQRIILAIQVVMYSQFFEP